MKKNEGNLKRTATLEEKLRKSKVVILILSPDFEDSDQCKNDVSLCYSHRKVRVSRRGERRGERKERRANSIKVVIPIMVKILKQGYPPKEMEFALKTLNPLDFVTMVNNPQKHSTMMRRLYDAISTGSVCSPSPLSPPLPLSLLCNTTPLPSLSLSPSLSFYST